MALEDVLPTLILLGILYAVYRWISGPSEYPPCVSHALGTRPYPFHFPTRNMFITPTSPTLSSVSPLTTGTPPDPFSGVRRDMVEAVTSVFPGEPLANVVYSLSRTRSAQVTSELLLERGSLPNVSGGVRSLQRASRRRGMI